MSCGRARGASGRAIQSAIAETSRALRHNLRNPAIPRGLGRRVRAVPNRRLQVAGRKAGAACLFLLANWSARFRSRFAYWGLRSLPRSLNRAWPKVRHFERNHQGPKNELIEDRSDELNVDGLQDRTDRPHGRGRRPPLGPVQGTTERRTTTILFVFRFTRSDTTRLE